MGVVRRKPRDWKASGQRYTRSGLNSLALVDGHGTPRRRRDESRVQHTAAFDEGWEGSDQWVRCVTQRRGNPCALYRGLFLLYKSLEHGCSLSAVPVNSRPPKLASLGIWRRRGESSRDHPRHRRGARGGLGPRFHRRNPLQFQGGLRPVRNHPPSSASLGHYLLS
jgi:hypothetical protein